MGSGRSDLNPESSSTLLNLEHDSAVMRFRLTPSCSSVRASGFAMITPLLERRFAPSGWVAEWFKAAVLKTAVGESPPWVRIPPRPPARPRKWSETAAARLFGDAMRLWLAKRVSNWKRAPLGRKVGPMLRK